MKYLLDLFNVMLSFFGVDTDKDSDKGKCTKCKYNVKDACIVGTVYANQGRYALCVKGEYWEKIEA